jgi:hypothetical protein
MPPTGSFRVKFRKYQPSKEARPARTLARCEAQQRDLLFVPRDFLDGPAPACRDITKTTTHPASQETHKRNYDASGRKTSSLQAALELY